MDVSSTRYITLSFGESIGVLGVAFGMVDT